MLSIPLSSGNIAKIVGIDPGTETLGIAIIHFNVEDFSIVQCEAATYKGSDLPSNDWTRAVYGDRYRRIEAHRNYIYHMLVEEQPLIVGCESPFITRRFPQAGLALTEVVCAIRAAVRLYDLWKPLYHVTPPEAKKAVGAKVSKDKNEVSKSILKIKGLTSTAVIPLNLLDEHSIDALAVAYCLLQHAKESKLEPLFI